MNFNFNWIDIVIIINILRSFFVGFKDGLSAEIIRLIKNIAALVIAVHIYNPLGNLICINSLYPVTVAHAVAFTFTVIFLYIFFYFVEKFVRIILQFTFIGCVESYGGMLTASVRSFISALTLVFMFSLMPVDFIVKQVAFRSYIGHHMLMKFPAFFERKIEPIISSEQIIVDNVKGFDSKQYYDYLNTYAYPEDLQMIKFIVRQ